MPSNRLPWDASKNRLSLLLEQKRFSGARLLDLTVSNPTRAGISYPAEEILAALADARALQYDPDPRGLPEARQAVAEAHGVAPEAVLLTASTSEAYAYLFKMLCDPGEGVLVPRPSYPLFDHLAALEGVELAPYDLVQEEGWRVGLDEVEAGAKAVIAVNPNNPTGSYLREADLSAFARLGLPLISDEVFHDYPLITAGLAARTRADLPVFTLGGLSKSAGLPQLKLGWIIATGKGAPASLDRLAAIADAYLSVSAPVMAAAPRLLAVAPQIRAAISARTRRNLDRLKAAAGKHLHAPQGGWYAVLEAPSARTDEEWALDLLEHDDVIVHPGYFFNFHREAFLVVSLLAREEEFAEGVARIVRRVDRAGRNGA